MLPLTLLALMLPAGVLVEPFRAAQSSVGHHQVCLRAAMAPDGHFAIAWVDSLQLPDHSVCNLYVRFFDRDGKPLAYPYKVEKRVDTNWVFWPCLEMDSSGNTVLVWVENASMSSSSDHLPDIRFQRFDPSGKPVYVFPQTLVSQKYLDHGRPFGCDINNRGEIAVAWSTTDLTHPLLLPHIWAQRFDQGGKPLDSAFMVHDALGEEELIFFKHPEPALNDDGDLVVTWLDFRYTAHTYPRFQAFDALNKPILPWEPMGYRLDDGDSLAGSDRPKPYWLNGYRFVVFWSDYTTPRPTQGIPILGRVFSDEGATRHEIRQVMQGDSLAVTMGDPVGQFSVGISATEDFAITYTRSHYRPDSNAPSGYRNWEHSAGLLGQVVNNEPWRKTNIFEYSAPWGGDTTWSYWNNVFHIQAPAVACSDDRIVWAYSRFNSDTIFEAWAVITDWDMGEDIVENPQITQPSDWYVANPIGREIVVRFWDRPGGFAASIFDASGRKVDELHSTERSGMIVWSECYGPGVYFIVADNNSGQVLKVILVK